MAEPGAQPVCKWAVIGAWRGSKSLFHQLVRTLQDVAEGPEKLKGEFRGGADWAETFRSPDEFDKVSEEMLRRFESCRIVVGGSEHVRVAVWIQRRQYSRREWATHEMPRAGAIAMVTGAPEDAVKAARRRLAATLKQGALFRPGPREGSGGCPDAPRHALLSRGLISDIGDMAAAFLFPCFVTALIMTFAFEACPKNQACNPLTVKLAPTWWPWLVAFGFGIALAVWRWFRPQDNPLLRVVSPVEIADTSAARRATAAIWKFVGYVVSPGALTIFLIGRVINAV